MFHLSSSHLHLSPSQQQLLSLSFHFILTLTNKTQTNAYIYFLTFNNSSITNSQSIPFFHSPRYVLSIPKYTHTHPTIFIQHAFTFNSKPHTCYLYAARPNISSPSHYNQHPHSHTANTQSIPCTTHTHSTYLAYICDTCTHTATPTLPREREGERKRGKG